MRDMITSLVIIIIGSATFIYSNTFSSTGQDIASDPALYPKVISVVLVLFGLILLIRTILSFKVSSIEFSIAQLKVLLLFVLLIFYLFALQYIGFIVSTVTFLFFIMLFLGSKKRLAVFSSISVTALLYVVFFVLFSIPKMSGLLF